MFRSITLLLLFLITILPLNLFGNEALNEANELYKNELYTEANSAYKNIIANDNTFSSAIYFNLASSYAMIGSNGEAILWYERALRISPFDKDINQAIEFLTNEKSNYPLFVFLNYLFVLIFITLFTFSVVFFIFYIKSKKHKYFLLLSFLLRSKLMLNILSLLTILIYMKVLVYLINQVFLLMRESNYLYLTRMKIGFM